MNKKLSELNWNELLQEGGFACDCANGMCHEVPLKEVLLEKGALAKVPAVIKKYGGNKAYIVADKNTWAAAGEDVANALEGVAMPYAKYVFAQEHIGADATPVGQAVLGFDHSCDVIVGVGTGTINDICKILGRMTGLPYICVTTAPSMDGFASDTSSMVADGVKVSLPSRCPVAIVADIDVLKAAPMKLLQAGLGDILAKYVSLFEWKLSKIINEEYYCPDVDALMADALERCVASAGKLLERDEAAVAAVMEALILSGSAMSFAKVTRPASGMEQYFSHLWDMRSLVFGTPEELHGIQVGIGTVQALKAYDLLKQITPDEQKALAYAANFDLEAHFAFLKEFLGPTADTLIELEQKEQKYELVAHKKRLQRAIENWPQIQALLADLPSSAGMEALLKKIGAYTEPSDMGIDNKTAKQTFIATKDIRDKYIGSRLFWDLGVIDAFADEICRVDV